MPNKNAQDKNMQNIIRVISVDPGYDRLGIAVIEKKTGGKEKLLYSDCCQTSAADPFVDRLLEVISLFKKKIQEFSPDFFAVETLFFSTNVKTAMRVAEVRGALLFVAKEAGLGIMEINPMQIKLAVTGDGKSDKAQMIKMIRLITGMDKKAKDDEYDAIAAGIAFHAMYRPGLMHI
jgi:crossover junction endodeoxyribonuclease RuvC